MRIGLAQINTTVGDLEGNVERCLAAIDEAGNAGADLVVLPEMVLPGCPPRDILYDTSFVTAVSEALQDLARRARDLPPVVVGTIVPSGSHPAQHPGLHNAAVLVAAGETRLVAAKRLLPEYDVFYDPRWFLSGPALPPVRIAGRMCGFLVGEDMWDENNTTHPGTDLLDAGAELLVSLSASPYRQGVMDERLHHARRQGCSIVCVNLCGANDELIFDGRSFVTDEIGRLTAQLAGFEEEVRVVALADAKPLALSSEEPEQELYAALVLGVRDFARKNQVEHAFLGLSGGIDSAVVAVMAAEALGPEGVTAVHIPSRYTNPRSTSSARELAKALGTGFELVHLDPLHEAAEDTLGELLVGGTTAENVQARLRALILMSFVNHQGGMLLNTSNKTEIALGYATLYGDAAGTLSPLGDVTKPGVAALARWINRERDVIPRFTLERPPTAELKPGQVDPFDYDVVGPAMERLVLENRSNPALRRSEHKRWQMGVVLKVTRKAFGTGRMMPITRR